MASEGAGRRVLLVEDEDSDRTAVARALRAHGSRYTLVEATTGEAGLALSQGPDAPDCVLLDYFLADMTALDFLRRLRTADGGPVPVAVAVLTAHDDDRAAAEAIEQGAEDFLRKDSIEPHSLMRAIENSIERHRIRAELEQQRAEVESRNRKLERLRDELQGKVAELADATRAKDRFLAVMSHEMRTPLNAILGYSDLLDLEMDGPLTEGQRSQLQRIRVGSRHLLDLINNVLDLTRADVRKLELDIRPVDVVAVIEEVVALLESEAIASKLTLSFEQPTAPVPLVEADLQRLRQIITNLVGNALKFTDEGSVTVSVGTDGDMVAVQVRDTGIGIEADTIPLVFDEFYQVKGDLTRRHGGSGLGLAISQQLAELMAGSIEVESKLGEGSTFTLRLHRAGAGQAARAQDTEDHQDWRDRRDAPVRAPISVVALGADAQALADLQRRVAPTVRLSWTTDPDHLTDLALAEGPSLVLIDISAPGGEFWSAAFALQEDAGLRDTAILLLPSVPAAAVGERVPGLDLGWVSLIPKPFTAEQLTAAISRARGPQSGQNGKQLCNVLVVDDDEDSRRVAAKFLRDDHVQIREAADGESALEQMRDTPPDVVVLDLMMPVLDGFGVLAAMRADPMLRGIPVVVLTAKTLTDAERQFLSRTAARVLQKGQHRLADVAALVLRAATQSPGPAQ